MPAHRLNEVIAARLIKDGAAPAALPSKSGAPPATWPTLLEISSMLPDSVVLLDTAPGTLKSIITITGTTSNLDLSEDLYRRVDSVFRQILGWKGRVAQVSVVVFSVLVIFEKGCSRDDVRRLKQLSRRSWSMSFTVAVNYICLDLVRKRVKIPWWAADAVTAHANAALDQVEVAQAGPETTPAVSSDLGGLASIIFQPFVDFVEGIKLMFRPRLFAERISRGNFDFAALLRYALAAVVLTALFEKVTKSESGIFGIVDLPIADEAVGAGILLSCYLAVAGLFHFFIRIAGGKGKFKYSFYATAIVCLSWLPLTTALEGVLGKRAAQSISYGSAIYLSALFGPLHGISPRRAFWFTQGGVLLLIIITGLVIIAVQELKR